MRLTRLIVEYTFSGGYAKNPIKRFGDYLIDLDAIPTALDEKLNVVF